MGAGVSEEKRLEKDRGVNSAILAAKTYKENSSKNSPDFKCVQNLSVTKAFQEGEDILATR